MVSANNSNSSLEDSINKNALLEQNFNNNDSDSS